MDRENCTGCGSRIEMIVQRGTPHCSQRCRTAEIMLYEDTAEPVNTRPPACDTLACAPGDDACSGCDDCLDGPPYDLSAKRVPAWRAKQAEDSAAMSRIADGIKR